MELADKLRYLGVLEKAQAMDQAIHAAALEHDWEPWRLAREVARVWLEQGHISSLTPGAEA